MTGLFIDTLAERDAARAEAERLRRERDALIKQSIRYKPFSGEWVCVLNRSVHRTRAAAWAATRESAGLDPEGD